MNIDLLSFTRRLQGRGEGIRCTLDGDDGGNAYYGDGNSDYGDGLGDNSEITMADNDHGCGDADFVIYGYFDGSGTGHGESDKYGDGYGNGDGRGFSGDEDI